MIVVLILSALYICLALAVSLTVARFIPSGRLPDLRIPRGLEQSVVGGVIVFACFSLFDLTAQVAGQFDLSYVNAFIQVLYGTMQGKGWLGLLGCGAIWYGADAFMSPRTRHVTMLISSLGFIVFTAVASYAHSASLTFVEAAVRSLHLLAVSVWLGFLFLAGWFTRARSSWRSFLDWFFPLAAACFIVVAATGAVLANASSNDWLAAKTLDYGQALLIKHLVVMPLLVFALVDGLVLRRKIADMPDLDPRGWFKAESVVALGAFAVTAVLSRQVLPLDVGQTLRYTPPSRWFLPWYDGVVTPDIQLTLAFDPLVVVLAAASVLCLGMIPFGFRKRARISISLCASLLFVVFGYLAFMSAIR